MTEIEKYARAAASTARTPPNSPARQAAIEAENAARVAAEQFAANREQRIADLETKVDTLKRLHDELAHGHQSQHDADSAELRRVCADRDAARKERDEFRASIRARPLPTGQRQAVRLTDAEIAEAFLSRCPAHLRGAHDVRDMQARPDVMEMGRAIEAAVLAANRLETK